MGWFSWSFESTYIWKKSLFGMNFFFHLYLIEFLILTCTLSCNQSQKREMEISLVSALKRVQEKERELEAVAAENQAAVQLVSSSSRKLILEIFIDILVLEINAIMWLLN